MAKNMRFQEAVLAGVFLGMPFAAFAAGAVPTPGAVEAPLKRPPIEPPKGTLPETVVPAPRPAAAPSGGPKVLVKEFVITGNQVFSTEELLAVIADRQGKRLTLEEIYQVADQLTRYYRERGYTLSSVAVPAQKVSSGTVRLEVIEGRVGQVMFQGNRRYKEPVLSRMTGDLVPGELLGDDVLERDALLLNDLPGLNARAIVEPGAEFGTSDLVFRTEEDPFDGSVRLNNYGREAIGEWRAQASFNINNPLGFGDLLSLNLVRSEQGLLSSGQVGYSLPVGGRGTRVGANVSRFIYDVDVDSLGSAFAGLDLGGDANNYQLQVTHPWIRSRQRNVILGLSASRNETNQNGTLVPVGDERAAINLLEGSVLFNQEHKNRSITTVTGTLSTNFKRNQDGTKDNAEAARLEVDASHLHPLGHNWSVYVRGDGVLSRDPLADTELFRLGGPGNVRGFPASEVGGDQGLMLTLEARRHFEVSKGMPAVFRAFWDGGKVYRKEPAAGEESNDSLTSVGVGVTVGVTRHISVDLEAVKPTNNWASSDDRDGGRIWAEVSASF